MCIYGGYKTQTVVQLGNLIGAFDAREISLAAVRVYLGALLSVAAREAAKRRRTKLRERKGVTPRYLLLELSRSTALPLERVRKELRALEGRGLLRFGQTDLVFEESEQPDCSSGLMSLTGGRSGRRPIPLPRPLLRFLARCSTGSLIKTALAYCVRGLAISRSGAISGKGSVKATTIASALKLSERSVRSARSYLLEVGFLFDDEGSTQIKLNRTGAYFSVNLSWIPPRAETEVINRGGLSGGALKSPQAKEVPVDNFAMQGTQFAPLPVENGAFFAPPYKDKKTLFRSKNQETRSFAPNPSGICTAKIERRKCLSAKSPASPTIRDVREEDLQSFGRVEELYRQAVRARLIEASEASAINFLAAAARARELAKSGRVGEAPRVFMGIIRGKLWKHITQADEDRALGALRKYRGENPDRFRVAA